MGGGGSSEENRTINQLLAELDGLSSKEAIVVVAATNYPEAIDKALLREGRFDRKVNIPMPDKKARTELFEFYLNRIITGDPNCKPKVQVFKPRTVDSDDKADGAAKTEEETKPAKTFEIKELKDIKVVEGVSNKEYADALADRTPGVSPAQISTIVNEAALNSAMHGKDVVPLDILQESIDDVLIGKKHRQRMSDKSLERTAYHEVGHCIMAWLSPLQKDVVKISIIPRGRAGGYTQQVQDEAMEPHTDEFLFSQLCVLMGGRVAERIFMDDISTGAMDDLQRATRLSMEKLLNYGMSKTIGQLAFKPNDKNDGRAWMTWSEELHAKVEDEARQLVASAYSHTEKTLLEMRQKHEALTQLLLSKKELNKADIEGVLGARPAGVTPATL
ncbi:ATP-dependent zinc metallopeptidase [Strigomonas culicis]|nr:ATP-dependent zinc metallopeptidase [Strigomonas culicis]|eukprot:EPY27848.1 ATP-dependent zinc metallopeptidase [Strigomonas culicis]